MSLNHQHFRLHQKEIRLCPRFEGRKKALINNRRHAKVEVLVLVSSPYKRELVAFFNPNTAKSKLTVPMRVRCSKQREKLRGGSEKKPEICNDRRDALGNVWRGLC
jgi:hypothetical protein